MSKIKRSFIVLVFGVMALSFVAGIATINNNFVARAADENAVAVEMLGGASIRCATENGVTTAGIRFSAKAANKYIGEDYTIGMSINNGNETRFFEAKKFSAIDDNYSRFNVVLNDVDPDTVFKATAKIKNADGIVAESSYYSERSFRQTVNTASMAGVFDDYSEEERLEYEKLKALVSDNLIEKVDDELCGARVESRFPEKITYVYTQNKADLADGASVGIKINASYKKDATSYYLPINLNTEMKAGETYAMSFDFKILNKGGNDNFYYLLNTADSTGRGESGGFKPGSTKSIYATRYNTGEIYSCFYSVTADKDYGKNNPFVLYIVLSAYDFTNFEFTLCNLNAELCNPELKVLFAYSNTGATTTITTSTIATANVGYYSADEKVVKIQSEEAKQHTVRIVTSCDVEKSKAYTFYFSMRQACTGGATGDNQYLTSQITAALKSGGNTFAKAASLKTLSGIEDYRSLSSQSEVKFLNRIDFTATADATDIILEIGFSSYFSKFDVEINQIACVETGENTDTVAKFTQQKFPDYNYNHTNAWLSDDAKYLTGDAKYALVVNRYRDANEDSTLKLDSKVNYSTGISLSTGSYKIAYDIVVNDDYPIGTYNGTTFTKKDAGIYAGVSGLYGYLGSDGTSSNTKGAYSLAEMCQNGIATKITDGNKTIYRVTIDVTTTNAIDDLTFTFLFDNNRRGTLGLCNFVVTPLLSA